MVTLRGRLLANEPYMRGTTVLLAEKYGKGDFSLTSPEPFSDETEALISETVNTSTTVIVEGTIKRERDQYTPFFVVASICLEKE